MNKRTTLYLHGKLYWAKIFGKPRPNYDGDANEWTFEFEPDEDSVRQLEGAGIGDRLKDKRGKKGYEGREPYLTLKRSELTKDGEKNEHIRVVDADNKNWNGGQLGNLTEADVKVTVVDYGPRKKHGVYPVAIRVLEHVAYEPDEFKPLADSDPRRKRAAERRGTELEEFNKDFGIDDDDVPFETDPKHPNFKGADDLDDDVEL